MINLDNFCPLWCITNITSDFCNGCEYIEDKCNYCSDEEREEIHNTLERLQIGL